MEDFFTSSDADGAPSALLSGGKLSGGKLSGGKLSGGQDRLQLRLVVNRTEEVEPDGPIVDYSDPERALETLHREFAPRLLAYTMSMLRNREDAEDAVQTTFMNVYNSLVDGRVPRQEASWLFRIARNVCLNRIRTHQRKPAGTLDGIDVAATQGVEEQLDQHLHAVALRSALERLPEQQRKAIVLRELQGASYAEIADALHTTQGAVESLIFRARRQLATSIRAAAAPLSDLATVRAAA